MFLVSLVDLLFQTLVSLRVQKIAFHVVNALDHPGPELRIERRGGEFGDFFSQHLSKTGSVKVVAGEADDCELFGQDIVLSEVAERGDEFALGEVAGGAENDHHARGRRGVHVRMVQAHERGFLSSAAGWQPKSLVALFFFDVSAELKAHGAHNFGCEIILAARREPLEQRCRQYRRWRSGLDGRENGPASFAGIRNAAGKAFERRLFEKGDGGQVEKPRRDNAAAAPDFRDVREIEVILIVLWIAEGSGF